MTPMSAEGPPSKPLSTIAQSCPTLLPTDCSPPGSSVHGTLQARAPECSAISSSGIFWFSRIFPTQGSNLGLPLCRQILLHVSHRASSSI